eukprot:2462333-Prymnesium_polylepis.1
MSLSVGCSADHGKLHRRKFSNGTLRSPEQCCLLGRDRIVCTMVPLNARCVGSAALLDSSASGFVRADERSCKRMCGFRVRSCALGRLSFAINARLAVRSPAIPATGSVWPTLAFSPPSGKGLAACCRESNAVENEVASTGSPNAVPVP